MNEDFPSIQRNRRRRILLSAFAVSPSRGSEAAVGWNIATRLGKYHDVVVLHAERDHEQTYGRDIRAYLTQYGEVPGVKFVSIAKPPYAAVCDAIHDLGFWYAYYWGYASWQRAALKTAMRLQVEQPFDLVHHLNMIGFREPGYLWKLNLPFVWGPISGAVMVPWSYMSSLGLRGAGFHILRNIENAIHMRFVPRVCRAARAASQIWVVSPADYKMVTQLWRRPAAYLLETGCAEIRNPVKTPYDGKRPIELAWSGLHVSSKALPILLDALRRLDATVRWHLTVLGKGPETASWQRIATDYGIDQRISWLGQLSRDAAVRTMSRADVFVFTSIKEGTPHVVAEALGAGLPVVCVAHRLGERKLEFSRQDYGGWHRHTPLRSIRRSPELARSAAP